MPTKGADPDELFARLATLSLAVHTLLECLLIAGVLTPTDLETMRNFGLQLATDLQGKDGVATQASGARVEAEVRRILGRHGRAIGHVKDALIKLQASPGTRFEPLAVRLLGQGRVGRDGIDVQLDADNTCEAAE